MCVYILFLQLNHFQINYESHDIAALNTLLHTSKNRHSFSWRTIVLLSHLTKITLVFLILIQYSVDTQIFQGFPHTQKNVLYNFLSDQQPVKNLLLHDVSCFFYVNNFLHYHSYPLLKKIFLTVHWPLCTHSVLPWSWGSCWSPQQQHWAASCAGWPWAQPLNIWPPALVGSGGWAPTVPSPLSHLSLLPILRKKGFENPI